MKMKHNVSVPLAALIIDRTKNVREQDDSTYKVDALAEDIALRGQLTPAVVEKFRDGDKDIYIPIQGFLRSTAMKQLAEKGVIDPNTAKRDDEGNIIPNTGKPFTHIIATVYEDLTERERTNLLVDHGQRRGLTRAELYFAHERLFAAGYSEKEIAVLTRSLLELHYPPSRKIGDTDEDLLNYYRGVIQTAKEAFRSPVLLRNAWVAKLRGQQTWPIKSEMMDGAKIFRKECDEDGTMKTNRENPGPKFMEWWDRLVKKQEEAKENGETRAKSVSMLSRGQIEDIQKGSDSRIVKVLTSIILNDGKVDRGNLPLLDKLLVDVEKGFTPDQSKLFESVFAK